LQARQGVLLAQPDIQVAYEGVIRGHLVPRAMQHMPIPGDIRDFVTLDLGYPGEARTHQYEELRMPKAPVFHTYHPTGPDPRNPVTPAYSLSVKIPVALNELFLTYIPPALTMQLRNTDNIEIFWNIQDRPWALGNNPATNALLFRPHSWLDPDAPNIQRVYDHRFNIQAGVFSRDGRVHIQGQGIGLINDTSIVHDDGERVVSSPPTLPIEGLRDESQVLYSFVRHGNRVAVTSTLLLIQPDQQVFDEVTTGVVGGGLPPRNMEDLIGRVTDEGVRRRLPQGQRALDEFFHLD